MKKLNVLTGLLFGIMLLSCSSNDSSSEISNEELLTTNSPWTFSHYELVTIIDSGNSNLSQTELENHINERDNGIVLVFNQDGSGSLTKQDEYSYDYSWEIINNDKIVLTYDTFFGEVLIVNISSNQLITTVENYTSTYDENVDFWVLHNGNYFYE